MIIIGIGGEKHAGKNTAAQALVEQHGFKEISFAAPLKHLCSEATGIPYIRFDDNNLKDVPFTNQMMFGYSDIVNLVKSAPIVLTQDQCDKLVDRAVNECPTFSTPRQILQYVGTELFRECVDTNYWCNVLAQEVKKYEKVVIPDVRFANERSIIRSLNGDLILIKRESLASSDGHISENQLGDESEYDKVFENNSTVKELHSDINSWYIRKTAMEKLYGKSKHKST